MRFAIFDLDNTLLAGDSDLLWGQFLCDLGLVDADRYARENRRYYDEYVAGRLDIHEFAAFSLRPLAELGVQRLLPLRRQFVAERIAPIVAPRAPALLERHRAEGAVLVITTATNRFVTDPIAELLGVEHLIATEPEVRNGGYTGRIDGVPNFREGKPVRLAQWLQQQDCTPAHITAYSDSHNDLPLLEASQQPVAVDPDDTLRAEAERRGWPVISLRE